MSEFKIGDVLTVTQHNALYTEIGKPRIMGGERVVVYGFDGSFVNVIAEDGRIALSCSDDNFEPIKRAENRKPGEFKVGDVCELTTTIGGTTPGGRGEQMRPPGTLVVIVGDRRSCYNVAQHDATFMFEESSQWSCAAVDPSSLRLVTPAPAGEPDLLRPLHRLRRVVETMKRPVAVVFDVDGTVKAFLTKPGFDHDENISATSGWCGHLTTAVDMLAEKVVDEAIAKANALEAEARKLRESVQF